MKNPVKQDYHSGLLHNLLSKSLLKKWQGIWIKRKEVWQPCSQMKAEHSSLLLLQMKHSLAHAASQRFNHEGANPNRHLILGAAARAVGYTLCVRVHSARTFELAAVKHFLHVAVPVKVKARWQTTNKHKCCWGRSAGGVVFIVGICRLEESLLLRNNQWFFYSIL